MANKVKSYKRGEIPVSGYQIKRPTFWKKLARALDTLVTVFAFFFFGFLIYIAILYK